MSTTNTAASTPGSSPDSSNAQPIGNFSQPVLAIADPQAFGSVRSAIEAAFSSARVEAFLKSLDGARLRIRDFESVLGKGKLGEAIRGEYARLGNGDQGQIREFYLASLEQIAPALRDRFFRLYAYY